MDPANFVDEWIDAAELEKFRKNYEDQVRRGIPSAIAVFSYAHALIKSSKEDVKTGIFLLEGLLKRDSEDVPKRDYVYYLSVAHTRLKEYDRALDYIGILLAAESDNRQALELKQLIEKRMKRDGFLGLAVLGLGGSVALAAGVIAAGVLSRRH
ncbi:mitochondrial fission 1 protein [Ditylenchus destructor]|uniref:Mitochondrial fission 1 protein n=1 Tax=Ditylenchus destructor TaxID=166010 RepID=A0AAD4R2T8_9BILA|nr:mitochondrial fission 1 protein [Ditylenchus destructor]